jgi:hypothetical protein
MTMILWRLNSSRNNSSSSVSSSSPSSITVWCFTPCNLCNCCMINVWNIFNALMTLQLYDNILWHIYDVDIINIVIMTLIAIKIQ